MASLQSFLAEAKDVGSKKKYSVSESNRRQEMKYSMMGSKKKRRPSTFSSMFLMSDFGVPLWQRIAIESAEGLKTLKGVGKDLITKEAWTNPKKNKQWTENLGQGFTEARNRVKSSLRKANDANIEKELMKNKGLDLQVDRMRQSAKNKYTANGVKNLAPLTRQEPDGLLSIDRRYKVGKEAKK